ncbi:MAG TPA: TetR/AcrR family transcriptional regulator [Thermomonas sp.]|jgi:AcrR family transcriptional regulator|uniref:TetR/AcrR family transcriptional regulator n=1 Tax=Thermomonas sp. TaxID=1971895 RepID=UPI002C5CA3F1|nr:TetR/AcrR family transcriptional regulator [Thermomonas sp.]HOV96781.1 TetR/AcrR family transcriptional regulator [Thermomonas sp.]
MDTIKAQKKSPASRKRAPGRPVADTLDQREGVLDAALACFVAHGIAGTSLREIAKQAGVTPALLHYYFGDKAQLLAAVVEARVLPVFHLIRAHLLEAGDDMSSLVLGFVDGVMQAVALHPWWPQLWVREVLCEGGALRDLLLTKVAPELSQLLLLRFQKAQREGGMNPQLDPRLLLPTLVGLTLLPAAGAAIWRELFDAHDLGMQDVRRHALALLDRGLELTP